MDLYIYIYIDIITYIYMENLQEPRENQRFPVDSLS